MLLGRKRRVLDSVKKTESLWGSSGGGGVKRIQPQKAEEKKKDAQVRPVETWRKQDEVVIQEGLVILMETSNSFLQLLLQVLQLHDLILVDILSTCSPVLNVASWINVLPPAGHPDQTISANTDTFKSVTGMHSSIHQSKELQLVS